MMKLAEKVGFTLEARFRNARIVDGKYYDSIGYGILKSEWIHKHPDGFIGEP
jgi:putative hydrolase of HD superfamily